ncbi:hypothetical protein [Piscinibacter sp.]|jgi:hypothetical protein|uniref:hypothetical protein n=1 Tax=Piscinibacter sp. TaxID=1903157 RepID=UPI00355A111F
MNKLALGLGLVLAIGVSGAALAADPTEHNHHEHSNPSPQAATPPHASGAMKDIRQYVKYPDALRIHTLANMRDHLLTMGEIQEALASGFFDKASELAEKRLGMSSLELHGAHEVAKYMPKGMQDAGTAMHHTASQFAIVTKDASVTGDLKPVLASLAKLNQTCVVCHAAYRLQ